MSSTGEVKDAVRLAQKFNTNLYRYLIHGLVDNSSTRSLLKVELEEYTRSSMKFFDRLYQIRDSKIPNERVQEEQINVFQEQVKRNDKLKVEVHKIQRGLWNLRANGQRVPMAKEQMILQGFPELCVSTSPDQVPLTVLCEKLIHKYNLRNEKSIKDLLRWAKEQSISRKMTPIISSQTTPRLPDFVKPAMIQAKPAEAITESYDVTPVMSWEDASVQLENNLPMKEPLQPSTWSFEEKEEQNFLSSNTEESEEDYYPDFNRKYPIFSWGELSEMFLKPRKRNITPMPEVSTEELKPDYDTIARLFADKSDAVPEFKVEKPHKVVPVPELKVEKPKMVVASLSGSKVEKPQKVIPVPGSKVEKPQKVAPVPGSKVERPQKVIPVPGSKVEKPQKAAPVPGSKVERPQKVIPVPGSKVEKPQKVAPVPGSKVERPQKVIPVPGSKVEKPQKVSPVSKVEKPQKVVPALGSKVEKPQKVVPAPGSKIEKPQKVVQVPEFKVDKLHNPNIKGELQKGNLTRNPTNTKVQWSMLKPAAGGTAKRSIESQSCLTSTKSLDHTRQGSSQRENLTQNPEDRKIKWNLLNPVASCSGKGAELKDNSKSQCTGQLTKGLASQKPIKHVEPTVEGSSLAKKVQWSGIFNSPSVNMMVPSPAPRDDIEKPVIESEKKHPLVGSDRPHVYENKIKGSQHDPKNPAGCSTSADSLKYIQKRARLLADLELKKQRLKNAFNQQFKSKERKSSIHFYQVDSGLKAEKAIKATVPKIPVKYKPSIRQDTFLMSNDNQNSRKRPASSSDDSDCSTPAAKRARHQPRIVLKLFRKGSEWNVEQVTDRC